MREFPTIVTWALDNAETHATPAAIDEALAWFYGEARRPEAQIAHAESHLKLLQDKAELIRKGESVKGYTTARDGLMLGRRIAEYQATIAYAEQQIAELKAAQAPLHAAYDSQGGWPRYFLALTDSQDGHIHSSMRCSTCNREGKATNFGWLTVYSGTSAKELTAEVGPNACTTCFPWAETIRVEAEAAKKATKQAEREALAAEKARKAAEKGITTPEGGEVNTGRDNESWTVAKTLRTAEIGLTDAIYELIREQQHAVDPEWAWMYEGGRTTTDEEQASRAAVIGHLLRAIAFKTGRETREVFETHLAKAEVKIRKVDRDWAKDPRNPNRSK